MTQKGSFNGSRLHGTCVTVAYYAPELAKESEYDEKVDVRAIGIVLFLSLLGNPLNLQ